MNLHLNQISFHSKQKKILQNKSAKNTFDEDLHMTA